MSVDNKYRAILDYLVQPKSYDHSGDKTICYLTFGTDEILAVKRHLKQTWVELARNKGLKVHLLSMHQVLKDFFIRDDYRIEAGGYAVDDEEEMQEVYNSLGENIKNPKILEHAILEAQSKVDKDNGVLFITDLEAIHPFTRFGPIEQNIYNEVEVPIVVFYPGEISGNALKFLGFYPEDGNYRSKHF